MERAMTLFRLVRERYIDVYMNLVQNCIYAQLSYAAKKRRTYMAETSKSILHLYVVVVLYNPALLAMEGGRRKPE
jgi:hypothetical protein